MSDNRLADTTSPYLLQHKDNPVAWRPWSREALEEARAADKPILLSIGYASCHWCHVMAHESFEDEAVAEVMNRYFINIKVDREERPDVDQIYMSALHALGEQGGWPLTMFLTSGAEPFWGGTYFPRHARWGRPGFIEVLEAVARAYRTDRKRIDSNRTALMTELTRMTEQSGAPALPRGLVAQASARLAAMIDPQHGGIRGAPKFPQSAVMELIWRGGLRQNNADHRTLCLTSLERMSQGGIYDHIGGGLARYSVDERWLVPHFEKMLYDNAQYLSDLARAHNATGQELFRRRIEETIGWLEREMAVEGGFAASLDADSEGEEGKYYIWTPTEITDLLGEKAAIAFKRIYDITPAGNFEGRSIPNRLDTDQVPSPPIDEDTLAKWRQTLLSARETRTAPARDDKILTDWNGLTIAGLAEVADSVSRESWRDLAMSSYRFIMTTMTDPQGRLAHAYRDGRQTRPGFASDHAAMMKAAIALAETATDDAEAEALIDDATSLADRLQQDYAHAQGGYHLTAAAADDLILRPYTANDEATPNANAVAAEALIRLWHLTGDDIYRARADAIFTAFASSITRNVFATAALLNALDTRENGMLAVVVAAEGATEDILQSPLHSALRALADPSLIRRQVTDTIAFPFSHPLHGKTAVNGRETLYLCREGLCSPPLTDPARIPETVNALRRG